MMPMEGVSVSQQLALSQYRTLWQSMTVIKENFMLWYSCLDCGVAGIFFSFRYTVQSSAPLSHFYDPVTRYTQLEVGGSNINCKVTPEY